jgi:hypothetical protein
MTQRFYKQTLDTITNVLATFDTTDVIAEVDDAGLALEELRITDAQGLGYVGRIEWDEDGHPYFLPLN